MLQNTKSRNLLIELRPLWVAAIFYVMVHAGDFVSTGLCMAFVPGASEGNPLLRDPETLKFAAIMALKLKTLYGLIVVIPMSAGIYAATRNAIMSSIPAWFLSWVGLGVVYENLAILAQNGVFN